MYTNCLIFFTFHTRTFEAKHYHAIHMYFLAYMISSLHSMIKKARMLHVLLRTKTMQLSVCHVKAPIICRLQLSFPNIFNLPPSSCIQIRQVSCLARTFGVLSIQWSILEAALKHNGQADTWHCSFVLRKGRPCSRAPYHSL